jgi:titin
VRSRENAVVGNFRGMILGYGANGNTVEGNLIGVLLDGTAAVNTGQGVCITFTPSKNTIGGPSADAGNIIGNTAISFAIPGNGDGVFIQAISGDPPPVGNAILGNSIFANAGLGIELSHERANRLQGGEGTGFSPFTSGRVRPCSRTTWPGSCWPL